MPTSTLNSDRARLLLAKYLASGSSQTAFCKRHRVSLSLFTYWAPRLHPPHSVGKPEFREVSLPSASTPSTCIVTLPNGTRLEFPASHLGTAICILSGGKLSC